MRLSHEGLCAMNPKFDGYLSGLHHPLWSRALLVRARRRLDWFAQPERKGASTAGKFSFAQALYTSASCVSQSGLAVVAAVSDSSLQAKPYPVKQRGLVQAVGSHLHYQVLCRMSSSSHDETCKLLSMKCQLLSHLVGLGVPASLDARTS